MPPLAGETGDRYQTVLSDMQTSGGGCETAPTWLPEPGSCGQSCKCTVQEQGYIASLIITALEPQGRAPNLQKLRTAGHRATHRVPAPVRGAAAGTSPLPRWLSPRVTRQALAHELDLGDADVLVVEQSPCPASSFNVAVSKVS